MVIKQFEDVLGSQKQQDKSRRAFKLTGQQ